MKSHFVLIQGVDVGIVKLCQLWFSMCAAATVKFIKQIKLLGLVYGISLNISCMPECVGTTNYLFSVLLKISQ